MVYVSCQLWYEEAARSSRTLLSPQLPPCRGLEALHIPSSSSQHPKPPSFSSPSSHSRKEDFPGAWYPSHTLLRWKQPLQLWTPPVLRITVTCFGVLFPLLRVYFSTSDITKFWKLALHVKLSVMDRRTWISSHWSTIDLIKEEKKYQAMTF